MRAYLWLESERVGFVEEPPAGSPAFYWTHVDHLDTALAITDTPASGNAKVVWTASYEPYGLATPDEDPDGDSVLVSYEPRFPGQWFDGESGSHHNMMRAYSPREGRYLSADPIGQAGGSNTYRYVASRPVEKVDPLGLDATGSVASVVKSAKDLLKKFDPYRRGVEAASRARRDGFDLGAQDAIMHCVAACEAAKSWGEGWSSAAGYGNEVVGFYLPPPSTTGDLVMDTHNNARGYTAAECDDREESCRQMLNSGELDTAQKGTGARTLPPGPAVWDILFE